MAENAIQIIIDVLAQEGVTSLDSFTMTELVLFRFLLMTLTPLLKNSLV